MNPQSRLQTWNLRDRKPPGRDEENIGRLVILPSSQDFHKVVRQIMTFGVPADDAIH